MDYTIEITDEEGTVVHSETRSFSSSDQAEAYARAIAAAQPRRYGRCDWSVS